MGIKDLPKPGVNFKATTGAGNFQRKLSSAARYGALTNIDKINQAAIVKAIANPTTLRAIRRGGLSRLQQIEVRRKIQASDKTVTKEDKREIKQILSHLGRGAVAKEKKPAVAETSVKASDGSFLTEEQVRRNLARNPQLDELGIRNRRFRPSSGGGQAETTPPGASANEPALRSRRTVGTMERLGIKRKSTGFAQKPYENKPADKPAPQASPGGTRPIGL